MKIKQIINKCQKFITEQLQNSQVKSIIFFSVIFLMAGLSIITVGLILIPDSNHSTAVGKKLESNKNISENNDNKDESSTNQNLDETPSLEIETDPNEENDLPNNNENNNSINEQPSSSTTTNSYNQTNQNNNSSQNNSSSQNNNNSPNNNGSQNNNDTPNPSEGEGNTTKPTNPEPETPPELFSATCTKSGVLNIEGQIRSHLTEQITVNFRKDDETFYSAKFVASLESYEMDYDIDTIKELYTKTFENYQSAFKVSDNKAVFTDVTKAYIILDNLKYDNFYAGYGSVPANYKVFLSTFQNNYLCQRDS